MILMKSEAVMSYDEIYAQSITNSEERGGRAAKEVQYKPSEKEVHEIHFCAS